MQQDLALEPQFEVHERWSVPCHFGPRERLEGWVTESLSSRSVLGSHRNRLRRVHGQRDHELEVVDRHYREQCKLIAADPLDQLRALGEDVDRVLGIVVDLDGEQSLERTH